MQNIQRIIHKLEGDIKLISNFLKTNRTNFIPAVLKDVKNKLKKIVRNVMLQPAVPANLKKNIFKQLAFCEALFPIIEQLFNQQFELVMEILVLLEKVGFIREVKETLERLMKKVEKNRYLLVHIVSYAYEMGYYDMAASGMEHLKQFYGEDENLLYNLALVYYMAGKTLKADELVERLIKRGFYFGYGLAIAVNIAKGDFAKANEISKRYV